MATKAQTSLKVPASTLRHCLNEMPYRTIVFDRFNGETPLYLVAGTDVGAMGAAKALKAAHRRHGGACFYCKKPVGAGELTIDHADAMKLGGGRTLMNLLVSCRPCNLAKGHKPIEVFDPEAGREWLSAQLAQVQDRLNRILDPHADRV